MCFKNRLAHLKYIWNFLINLQEFAKFKNISRIRFWKNIQFFYAENQLQLQSSLIKNLLSGSLLKTATPSPITIGCPVIK